MCSYIWLAGFPCFYGQGPAEWKYNVYISSGLIVRASKSSFADKSFVLGKTPQGGRGYSVLRQACKSYRREWREAATAAGVTAEGKRRMAAQFAVGRNTAGNSAAPEKRDLCACSSGKDIIEKNKNERKKREPYFFSGKGDAAARNSLHARSRHF